MAEETKEKPLVITQPQDYEKLQEFTAQLPSGAVFKLKRKLDYGDYVDLMNMLAEATGKEANVKLLDEATENPKLQAKLFAFTIPRMVLNPKIVLEETDKSGLYLLKLAFDDMLFINTQAMQVQMRPEVQKVVQSFLDKQSSR